LKEYVFLNISVGEIHGEWTNRVRLKTKSSYRDADFARDANMIKIEINRKVGDSQALEPFVCCFVVKFKGGAFNKLIALTNKTI
jgi:hypothetical protein